MISGLREEIFFPKKIKDLFCNYLFLFGQFMLLLYSLGLFCQDAQVTSPIQGWQNRISGT